MNDLSWRTVRASGSALCLAAVAIGPALFPSTVLAQSGETPAGHTHRGELLPPDAIGPTIVEGWDTVLAREARHPKTVYDKRRQNGAQGEWTLPPSRYHGQAHSGEQYVINKWGDPRMGIGFGAIVDVRGAWIVGQRDASFWPASMVAVGYAAGAEVARTAPFTDFADGPTWFAMDFASVDRIELVAEPKTGVGAEYGLDDLVFVAGGREMTVTFEDYAGSERLTGTGYAGLEWEVGTGELDGAIVVHAPLTEEQPGIPRELDEPPTYGGSGTTPTLLSSFIGPGLGSSSGAGYVPPDTCGAVGPNHFVTVVNSNISVYVNSTGSRVLNTDLNVFLSDDGWGDPRVVYDRTDGRFIVLATDFNNTISIAISETSDPTGTWRKSSFNPGQGTDAGRWPDYPTLGSNDDFIVIGAYMVGSPARMTLFAIDKANFMSTGSLTVTAFRALPWEGAIHGAVTGDATADMFAVSRAGTGLRIRRVNLPANAPTLTELGIAATSIGSTPPSAPQSGGPGLSTLDGRLMNAVWENGSLWTTNCIASAGKAGCRWWEVDTSSITVVQSGTVDDATLYYFMPSIAVNTSGDVVMGFSGSHSGQFAGCYYTGRLASDPPGQMGPPAQYKAGEGSYNDGAGPRWGDYSLTSVDPDDQSIFWTLQEYARSGGGVWGTYIAEVKHDSSGCDIHNYCFTSTNSVGSGSLISHTGSASVAANDFGLRADFNPPNQNGVFFMGVNENVTFFGNGVLCMSGGITRYPIAPSNGAGVATIAIDNTVPPALGNIVPGATWKWQYWYRDPMGGGSAFNLSDGLSVTFCN